MAEAPVITITDIETWGKHAYGCECPTCKKVNAFREYMIELGWDFKKIQPIRRGCHSVPPPTVENTS